MTQPVEQQQAEQAPLSRRMVALTFGRLERYVECTRDALDRGDLVQAMADTAEVAEISRRLWVMLQAAVKQ